jgi:UDP-N-acetylmuramoyl-tripeptide--D-alanyl-D-alanine ligase
MSAIPLLYNAFKNGAAISTDTRNIKPGCIFFSLKGASFNGNTFALKALEAGAAFAVIDEEIDPANIQLIKVEDALTALQELAAYHRKQLKIPVIAITGSNGKTTTKELINRVLSKKLNTLCTKGNLNNHIGVPLTLLSITPAHEIAIVEMGANHQKEIELLCKIAQPTHALITNVGKAHLEGFGGFEGVKKGKGEMYDFAKSNQALVFINDDNSILKEMLGIYNRVFLYGSNDQSNIQGELIPNKTHVALRWKNKSEVDWNKIHSKITGAYNFENILSAVCLGVYFGINYADINSAIETYIPDNQRSQELELGSNHIVLDAYNANPTSMEAALRNFNANFTGKRAVFLGEMLELGSTSVQEHKNIIELLKLFQFDVVVLVGNNFKEALLPENYFYFNSSNEAAVWTAQQKLVNYNMLIKGSRGSKMEKLLEGISG